MSALWRRADRRDLRGVSLFLAMCGRLRVGKGFLTEMHRWSVLPCVLPVCAALDMAAGPNALRGSGPCQKHAVAMLHWLKWGVPFRGPTGWVHYPLLALSNFRCAVVARCLMRSVCQAPDNSYRAPSSPRQCGRSCWQGQWPRSSVSVVRAAWSARAFACNRAVLPGG